MADLTDLITRKYSNFRGVDFSNSEVNYYRSPNAKNMWKNYEDGSIETRPGMKLLDTFGNRIYGLFFLNKDDVLHVLVHAGTKLLKWANYPNTPAETTELFSGMNVRESNSFVFDNTLFIKMALIIWNMMEQALKKLKEQYLLRHIGRIQMALPVLIVTQMLIWYISRLTV